MRGNGLGAEAGIENIRGNGSRQLGNHWQRGSAMHATQHLPERKMVIAQMLLRVGAVAMVAVVAGITVGMRMLIVRIAIVPVVNILRIVRMRRAACGMPCGVRQRALLRNQQQEHTKIMEQSAWHGRRTNHLRDRRRRMGRLRFF